MEDDETTEEIAEAAETPEPETDPEVIGTPSPETETDDTDTDGDDADGDGDDATEDIDEDADLPDSERQLRAVLRANGYTFTAEGTPVPPAAVETPAAAPAPVVPPAAPAAVETPADPVPDPYAHPTEFKDFPVRADGLDLLEPALENPNSPEARELIDGTVDENGDIVTEGIGLAQYQRLVVNYERAKTEYAQDVDYRSEQAIHANVPAFRQQVVDTHADIEAKLAPLGDANAKALVAQFAPRASGVIEAMRAEMVADYVAKGIPPKRAALLVDADAVRTPDLYGRALAQAALENFGEFVETVVRAARGESIATATPSTPAAPAVPAAKPAPPRPPVPSVVRTAGGAGGGSAPPARAVDVLPSKDEADIAKSLGLDAKQFAAYVKENG